MYIYRGIQLKGANPGTVTFTDNSSTGQAWHGSRIKLLVVPLTDQ